MVILNDLDKGLNRESRLGVVTMGGSITENKRGHSAQIPEWLKQRFPKADFQFTNAGIASTCSTTGAFRLETDVLSTGRVDLLIVEFAVNDDQDAGHAKRECIRGMEGIVRHLRRAQPRADILMVQYVNPGMLETVDQWQNSAGHFCSRSGCATLWNPFS